MNAWVHIEGCVVPANGGVTPPSVTVQQKTQTLYYVAVAGQTSFPLSAPDLFGASYHLTATTAAAVSKGGLRLIPDDGSGTGGYVIDTASNSIHLLWPAGDGEILVVDIFWDTSAAILGQTVGEDVLAVTAPNVLSLLSRTPDGRVFVLYVEGRPFFPIVPSPPFSYSGKTITWLSTVYSLSVGNEVVALYTSSS